MVKRDGKFWHAHSNFKSMYRLTSQFRNPNKEGINEDAEVNSLLSGEILLQVTEINHNSCI